MTTASYPGAILAQFWHHPCTILAPGAVLPAGCSRMRIKSILKREAVANLREAASWSEPALGSAILIGPWRPHKRVGPVKETIPSCGCVGCGACAGACACACSLRVGSWWLARRVQRISMSIGISITPAFMQRTECLTHRSRSIRALPGVHISNGMENWLTDGGVKRTGKVEKCSRSRQHRAPRYCSVSCHFVYIITKTKMQSRFFGPKQPLH